MSETPEISERIFRLAPLLVRRISRKLRAIGDGSSYQNLGEGGETYWAGEGGGASGILPVCQTTRRICLAWRSSEVHIGDCWGTLGGAIQRGLSPQESAMEEMREETGYHGRIELHNAYVFVSGRFRYYNYVGIVDQEFGFNPASGHSWETDHIEWMTYEKALQEIDGGRCHPGLKALFHNSESLIQQVTQPDPEIKRESHAARRNFTRGFPARAT